MTEKDGNALKFEKEIANFFKLRLRVPKIPQEIYYGYPSLIKFV